MTNNNNNLNNLPYAQWLEKALHDIIGLPVKGISMTVILDGGDAYTNYYNTSMSDKLIIAGLVQQDAMLDSMAATGLIKYADEEDDSDGEEKE